MGMRKGMALLSDFVDNRTQVDRATPIARGNEHTEATYSDYINVFCRITPLCAISNRFGDFVEALSTQVLIPLPYGRLNYR
jgi:hypothetical protein